MYLDKLEDKRKLTLIRRANTLIRILQEGAVYDGLLLLAGIGMEPIQANDWVNNPYVYLLSDPALPRIIANEFAEGWAIDVHNTFFSWYTAYRYGSQEIENEVPSSRQMAA